MVGTSPGSKDILQEESKLEEIVRLVGADSLEFHDRLTMECARSIREDLLHQNAFDAIDTYTSLNKQYGILKAILTWYHRGQEALKENASFNKIINMKIRERIGRMKYIKEEDFDNEFAEIMKAMNSEFQNLMKGDDLYA